MTFCVQNIDIRPVDASNIVRNLYLTTQLKQFNKPILLLLNMVDVAKKKGIEIDCQKLSKDFNVTVLPIIAAKNIGIDKVKETLEKETYIKNIDKKNYNFKTEKEAYNFIENLISNCEITRKKEKKERLTDKIDRITLNPFFAYPLFIIIMMLIFEFTFSWVGQPISDLLSDLLDDRFIPFLHDLLVNTSPWFNSLIVDGIVAGVGAVVVLLPIILALFFCISILEDSGYMARTAFIMDKLMRKVGLSGKAFIPMIVGFGCSVPAIMSARTLESEKDRKLAALLVPLMSCNARLPIYIVFASVFFPNHKSLIVGSLYFLGVLIAFLIGLLFKNTLFKKDEEPFIIELPEYKLPEMKNVFRQTWDKGKSFLKKAGTIIFAMSVLIWVLQNFNFSGQVTDISQSFLYSIGSFIAPILKPLGFGTWQASVSLLTGLMAKETVLSTMEVIFKGNLEILLPQFFTAISAYSFLIFVLLYTPCISVIGTMKKEFGAKMTIFSVIYQLVLAWIASFLFFNIANFII
ncbi:ferrous iron transport protein B [Clostridium fallax]|uniref:Ferrous iron transport protein B n=1 Tax=Clostridium fallax TaxID=1533 RepID=A0A1M4ZMM7_9CLOT|nr:ferrous iron transport protein B [Clostridium fallax]SQB07391.1 ferrous iron transport protein B [Clostridium fallax]